MQVERARAPTSSRADEIAFGPKHLLADGLCCAHVEEADAARMRGAQLNAVRAHNLQKLDAALLGLDSDCSGWIIWFRCDRCLAQRMTRRRAHAVPPALRAHPALVARDALLHAHVGDGEPQRGASNEELVQGPRGGSAAGAARLSSWLSDYSNEHEHILCGVLAHRKRQQLAYGLRPRRKAMQLLAATVRAKQLVGEMTWWRPDSNPRETTPRTRRWLYEVRTCALRSSGWTMCSLRREGGAVCADAAQILSSGLHDGQHLELPAEMRVQQLHRRAASRSALFLSKV